jgi:enamine deaminase RidA (YjgF/YER057c/UK114 family)
VPPLIAKTLAGLRHSLDSVGLAPADALRVSCFVSSLQNIAESRALVETEFPHAALDFVQLNRAPRQALAACEAVARLHTAPPAPLQFVASNAGESEVALVSAPEVVLSGGQYSFGYQEADARLAFERLKKSIEQAGAGPKTVAYAHYYPLSPSLATEVRKVRIEFFDHPAATMLIFEGLPSMDAGFAVDVVAVK